jgi:hypothetical protein
MQYTSEVYVQASITLTAGLFLYKETGTLLYCSEKCSKGLKGVLSLDKDGYGKIG